MPKDFIVVDSEGLAWNVDGADEPARFKTHKQAKSRAEELAKSEPGKLFGIYERVAESSVPIGKPETKEL